MKGLGEEKNVFNTTSLIFSVAFQLIQTDEALMVNGRKHTDTHTHAYTHTHTHTHKHTHARTQHFSFKHMFQVLGFFFYFSDNTTIYNKLFLIK